MKNLNILLLTLSLIIISCKPASKKEEDSHMNHSTTQEETTKKKPLSPHTYAMTMIGEAHIHIDYSSPGVRDRIIFGGLVAYDRVWQAGAHMATWIETNKDLIIDGKTVPAGKYGFFTIPSKSEWTIILNKNWNQHGKDDYDEKEDVLRIKVTPEVLNDVQEHLTYKISINEENKGNIKLAWANVAVNFNFEVKQ